MRCLHFHLILCNLKVECWKLESSKLNAKVGCAICAICSLSNTNGVPLTLCPFCTLSENVVWIGQYGVTYMEKAPHDCNL
jgi:hypothetical protein